LEHDFTPLFGRSYIFMFHAERRGEFQELIFNTTPPFSTPNKPRGVSFVGKIVYGHHYVSIVFEDQKTR